MKKTLFSLIAIFTVGANAQAVTLFLSPSSSGAQTGDTIVVQVMLDTEAQEVDGVDLNALNYNPSMLELQDANSGANGIQISPGSLMPITTYNLANTAKGKILFSQVMAGGGQAYSGQGVLASATFRVLRPGTANLSIDFTLGSTVDSNVAKGGSDILTSVNNTALTLQGAPVVKRPKPISFSLKEGNTVAAYGSSDPDIYIVNEHGFKRLFLNPIIFGFYGHLGGFSKVKTIVNATRDVFETSGLFRNCETNDPKVYAVEVNGEDTGILHHLNLSGETVLQQDPEFFQKVFCINNREFNWYTQDNKVFGSSYTSLGQIPIYSRQ